MPTADPHAEAFQAALPARLEALRHIVGTDIIPMEEVAPHLLACALRQEALLTRIAESLESIDSNTERRGPGRPKGT